MVAVQQPRKGETVDTARTEDLVELFRGLARRAPEDAVVAAIRALAVAVDDQEKARFVARAVGAIARLAAASSQTLLREATTARSDLLVLLHLLERPEILAELSRDDPLVEPHIRGILARRWLLDEEGGVVAAEKLGTLLGGITRQGIDRRRKHGKLLALDLGRHGYAYPLWQVHEGRVLPGLDRVLAELDEFDPWMQAGFMLNPNTWLGGETPLAALRRGQLDRVLTAARALAE
jgi:hypothetical protein